jgi:tungstate transport system substrate-binding protein
MVTLPRRMLLTLGLTIALALLTLAGTARAEDRFITIASTTSTQDSGLFDYLLPIFTKKTGIQVHVVAVGTGQALKIGQQGDADVLFVHDRAGEEKFVAEGYGVKREPLMYNDFIIVGPDSDPAGIKGDKDAIDAFKKIAAAKVPFASRGDDSGTNRMELRLWKQAGTDVKAASGDWYKSLGQGMGPTLNTAAAMNAYTLSDRATWSKFANKQHLALLVEGDKRLFNQYGVILVNPAKHANVKVADGQAFIDWLISPEGQTAIAGYKIGGAQAFFPDHNEPGA